MWSLATTVSSLPSSGDCREVLPAGALCGKGTTTHALPFIGRGAKGSLGDVLGPAHVLSSKKLFLALPSLRQARHSPFLCALGDFPGPEPFHGLPLCAHCRLLGTETGPLAALSPVVGQVCYVTERTTPRIMSLTGAMGLGQRARQARLLIPASLAEFTDQQLLPLISL